MSDASNESRKCFASLSWRWKAACFRPRAGGYAAPVRSSRFYPGARALPDLSIWSDAYRSTTIAGRRSVSASRVKRALACQTKHGVGGRQMAAILLLALSPNQDSRDPVRHPSVGPSPPQARRTQPQR